MKNEIITVGIYLRVSTEEQKKHGYSIQAQKDNLIQYCKEKKYKIYDIYADEGKSARSKLKNRTEMCRLLQDVKSKKINRIVFIKLDRWFRNIADYYKVQEILEKNKVDWEATQEEYNTTTSSGRLNLNIRLSIAQDEADRTADRIKFTFDNMIKNKRAIYGSQCLPLGYIVSGEGKEKHVKKDPSTAMIVEDMFEHFKNFCSIRKTLLYINEKYGLTIHYDSMRNYLKNEIYTGNYKNVENYCEPYISKEEYVENQNRITKNIKDNKKKHEYIFSGMIKCYCCHYNMSGFTHKSIQKKYNRTYENFAYRCNRSYNSKLCKNRSPIFENNLEQYLIKNIINDVKQYIIDNENIEKKEEKKIVDINKIKGKLDRLTELYVEGKITKEKYDLDFNKYNDELTTAKKKNTKKKDLTKFKSLINSNQMEIYSQLDNTSKRAFWLTFIDYIERDKDLNYIIHFK